MANQCEMCDAAFFQGANGSAIFSNGEKYQEGMNGSFFTALRADRIGDHKV
jgi:hypothetical protein